jgi:hypothetical protein
MMESQMAGKEILTKIKDLSGVDPFVMDPDELPNTDEELSIVHAA